MYVGNGGVRSVMKDYADMIITNQANCKLL